jgi:hypothetical protein
VKGQVALCSRQQDRELGNLLTLQGELAHEVGAEIPLARGDGRNTANETRRDRRSTGHRSLDV